MKKVAIPLLIALSISAVVTVVLFFASGFLGGACHCMTPVSVLFPYGTFITMRTSWEATGFYVDVFQYPLYAVMIALSSRSRLLATFVIFVVHALAAVFTVNMYEWWR